MTTPLQLITLALKNAGVNGVGQAPSADDTNDCLTALNGMLNQWARRRWLIWHELDIAVTSTGATSYTIGPGQTFATTSRVDRLEGAYIRFNPGTSTPLDFMLDIIESREDWSSVMLKGLQAPSGAVFFDSGYPTGTLYFYPIPSSAYELHVLVKAPLITVTAATLNTQMSLPDEYFEALLYGLAIRIAPMYQLAPRPDVVALAKAAMATIRSANAQIPLLDMPWAIINRRGTGQGTPVWAGAGGGTNQPTGGVGIYGQSVYGGANYG